MSPKLALPPTTLSSALLALVLVVAPTPVLGAAAEGDNQVRSALDVELEASGLSSTQEGIELSLNDAISVALQRNLGLRIQRYQRAISFVQIQQNMAIYDLNIGGSLFMVEETSASASNLDGATVSESDTKGLNLRLDQLLPTGGQASLDWQNNRRASNSFFATVNPAFNIDFDFLYNQPLLRNRGKLATERDIMVARTNSGAARNDLALAVVDTVDAVEAAYWTLVEALGQLDVSQESLKLAEELHDMNKVQVEVGTLAPLELIQSEVGIATRQEEIIQAQQAVGDSSDALRELLNLENGPLWDATLIPTTDPRVPYIEVDLEESLAIAFEERLEIDQQELALSNLELDAKFFRNQRLPQVDLDLRYGFNGLGGDVREFLPGESPFDPNAEFQLLSGGYSDAWNQIENRDFEGWQAAIVFNYPLQNRRAKALVRAADLALEQGQTGLDQTLLQVRTEVRRSARAVRSAQQAIESAEVSRRLAVEQLDAEQKRYENGLSTTFEVLDIQEDLSQASQRLVIAITGYRRALVGYFKALGRLLDENQIELIDDLVNR